METLCRRDGPVEAADFTTHEYGLQFLRHVPGTEFAQIPSLLGGGALRISAGEVFETRTVLPFLHDLLSQFGSGNLNVTSFDPQHDDRLF